MVISEVEPLEFYRESRPFDTQLLRYQRRELNYWRGKPRQKPNIKIEWNFGSNS